MKKPVQTPSDKPLFPMRINKYLARQGVVTRRGADELIEKKLVFVNDKPATLGQMVNAGDTVEVQQRGVPKRHAYYVYYKPAGNIEEDEDVSTSSTDPDSEKRSRKNKGIPFHLIKEGVFPVDELDKNSAGLVILTNDGRITDRLLSPTSEVEREYAVTTKEKLRTNFKEKMEAGVTIEGEEQPTRPCRVQIFNERKFRVTVTESKKHLVRRMCVALFQEVDTLTRVRIANVRLTGLRVGEFRKFDTEERETFLNGIGLK